MSTSNVSTTSPGTTPFNIDVTTCNLLTDLTVKDFQVFVDGTLNCTGSSCTNWTKTTATQLTYSGTAIPNGTAIQIRRKTPNNVIQTVNFADRVSSSLWNNELDRVIRWREEADLNGVGSGSVTATALPIDDAYPTGWNGDIISPPTRNATYDALQLFAPLASPTFTGTPAAPTAADGTNTTQLATTAFATTRVSNALANSPTLGGNPTATTQSQYNDSTRIATTAFVQDINRPSFKVRETASTLNIHGLTTITWDIEEYDTDNCFDSTIFTAPSGGDGKYYMGTSVVIASTDAVTCSLGLFFIINGVTNVRLAQVLNFATVTDFTLNGSTILGLSAGDTVAVAVTDFNAGGVNVNIFSHDNATNFWGFKLAV